MLAAAEILERKVPEQLECHNPFPSTYRRGMVTISKETVESRNGEMVCGTSCSKTESAIHCVTSILEDLQPQRSVPGHGCANYEKTAFFILNVQFFLTIISSHLLSHKIKHFFLSAPSFCIFEDYW